MKLLNLFAFIKKNRTKITSFSSEDLLQFADQIVDESFHLFEKADEQLTKANAEILKAIETAQSTIDKAQLVLDKAENSLEKAHNALKANNALKVRLSDFM